MGPHTDDFDGALRHVDLIHQPMLDVDAPRICTFKIADELLERGRILEGILRQHAQQTLRLWLEVLGCDFLRVLLGLFRESDLPTHQPGFVEVLLSGTASPFRTDSRIPGIETK